MSSGFVEIEVHDGIDPWRTRRVISVNPDNVDAVEPHGREGSRQCRIFIGGKSYVVDDTRGNVAHKLGK